MKNKQKSGDNSTNIQAEKIIIKKGLTVEDTKKIVQIIYDNNFPKLQKIAANEARERVNLFKKELSEKISKKLSFQEINKISEPDIQYALFEAIKTNIRRNDKELRNILTELIIGRIKRDNSDLTKIIYNEAISTVGKLTKNQLKILTLHITVRYVIRQNIFSWDDFKDYLKSIESFLDFEDRIVDFQHLEFCSCISIIDFASIGVLEIFKNNYPSLFEIDKKINQKIKKDQMGSLLLKKWENSKIKNITSTSAGILIGIIYYEQTTGIKTNLNNWIY